MKSQTLDEFDFVDCYFHEFAVDPHLSKLTIKTEAYFPEFVSENQRKLGVLLITLEGITQLQADIRPPFSRDIESNEVYELRSDVVADLYHIFLTSDYLNLSVECRYMHLEDTNEELPS